MCAHGITSGTGKADTQGTNCRHAVKASGSTFEALRCSDMGQHREQVLLVQNLGATAHPAGVPRCADGVRCAALSL